MGGGTAYKRKEGGGFQKLKNSGGVIGKI